MARLLFSVSGALDCENQLRGEFRRLRERSAQRDHEQSLPYDCAFHDLQTVSSHSHNSFY